MLAKFFIDRPVFAIVLSLLIIIGGLVSIFMLPIEQYPSIVPPTIQITARYPGADAETVATSVAAPIEQQLSGAKNLLYYKSTASNDGSVTIVASFEIGTNQDIAAVEVQNRLSIATPRLPQEVVRNGITVTKASTAMLGVIALRSKNPQYDDVFLANYATINMIDAIKRVQGVGDAQVFGGKDYAMRVWVNPDKLALKGMTVSDVATAIREQNAVFPAGAIGQRPGAEGQLTLPALTSGRLNDPAQYENVILRAQPDGTIIRVKDVARVGMGSDQYGLFGRVNGEPTAFLLVFLQVGANALDSIKGVEAEMRKLSTSFPSGVMYSYPYDTTPYIRDSIKEVAKTFLEAIALVILVVFVFLQSWRATLIPLLAVPVAIIGAFAGMLALGFTINTLTLFGLVLAIGIVVDDAIVVVENVERIMHEEHLPPREATIKAMSQVTGPVITIVLVLCAVFVPVAFLTGLTGQLYRQFAITIAVSVVVSGIVALTLSPALCRLLLKPQHGKKALFYRGFDYLFGGVTWLYTYGVAKGVRHAVVALACFGVLTYVAYGLSNKIPSALLPEEDQGYFLAIVQLPDGASLDRTDELVKDVEKFFNSIPAVNNVVTLGGMDFSINSASTSAATIFVGLKPTWQRRGVSVNDVVGMTMGHYFGQEKRGQVFAFNMPAIQGLGNRAGFELELQSKGAGSINALSGTTDAFMGGLYKDFIQPRTNLRVTQPQLFVDLDRDAAQVRSVRIPEVFDTLQALLGALYVNDFDKFGRIWRVQIQAEPEFRKSPFEISRFIVRNSNGRMVPLSGLVNTRFVAGPNAVNRFNGYPSVQITGEPKPGISSGQAMAMLSAMKKSLPEGYDFSWTGASYQEDKTGSQAVYVLGFGIIVVFLLLAAQYESFAMPFAVLLTIPIAILGALVAIRWRGLSQDIYFQVGMLTLVGLSAKNAILIVEFCIEQVRAGVPAKEAALQAAKLRFRPIVMTSLAFILGVVPLAVSKGAGANARHSIGTGVIGGMLAATFIATFLVPVFFVILHGITRLFRKQPKPLVNPTHVVEPATVAHV